MKNADGFLKKVIELAQTGQKHIVLPEGGDSRIIEAAAIISSNKIAALTLLGQTEQITTKLKQTAADTDLIDIIDPAESSKTAQYSQMLYELRKDKGLTEEKAAEIMRNKIYFGTMMVKAGDADGLVAGAANSTADTVRPALQIIKSAEHVKTISGLFFMCSADSIFLFADCGVVENPSSQQLADIAFASAQTALKFGIKPRIAMLSYSTHGSAKSPNTEKVAQAYQAVKDKIYTRFGDEVVIDGEIQFDAAVMPDVAEKKCPDSPLKGSANVFIFPNLEAGNIGYKIAERIGKLNAYGPVLQGLAKPVNDLSRGCCAQDVVATVAITAIQAAEIKNI